MAEQSKSSSCHGSGTRKPLVIGISGATCGGKTTLSKLLQATFPWASVIHQDAYFHPNDPKYHVYLPDIDYFNWELETALDFERMEADVKNLLRGKAVLSRGNPFFDNMNFVLSHQPAHAETENLTNQFSQIPIIIIEGHILFNRPFFNKICDQKFFLTLDKEECHGRRQNRVYDPMPPYGFFDMCVWPSYESRLKFVQYMDGITFMDANNGNKLMDLYQGMKAAIVNAMMTMVDARYT